MFVFLDQWISNRKWYFEKADWIVSDEIEDEATEEVQEEEEQEVEVQISTVALGETSSGTKICPVCREDFDQFYKQVSLINSSEYP